MMSCWDGLSYENNIGKSYFLEVSNHSAQLDKKKNGSTDQVQKYIFKTTMVIPRIKLVV